MIKKKKLKITYEKAEMLTLLLTKRLIKIYFAGVNRKKVSALEMLDTCPKFIKKVWKLTINKALELNERNNK